MVCVWLSSFLLMSLSYYSFLISLLFSFNSLLLSILYLKLSSGTFIKEFISSNLKSSKSLDISLFNFSKSANQLLPTLDNVWISTLFSYFILSLALDNVWISTLFSYFILSFVKDSVSYNFIFNSLVFSSSIILKFSSSFYVIEFWLSFLY